MRALALPMTNTRFWRVTMLSGVKPAKVACYLRGWTVHPAAARCIVRAIKATDAEMRARWAQRHAA